MTVRVRRAYDPPAVEDGCRVLVDRLWPRGLARENARIEHWLRELAPSNELRKWFAHDEPKWPEFKERYFAELDAAPAVVAQMLSILRQNQNVILLYSAKDTEMNNAVALKEYIEGMTLQN